MDFIDLTSLHSYSYLLVLAAILLTTKLLGLFSRWVRLPQVLGALVAGVILGPVVNAIVGWSTGDGFFYKQPVLISYSVCFPNLVLLY